MATPTPLIMADNNSRIEEEDNRREEKKGNKKKLKQRIQELETALEKQEGRLSHLQSSAFQLANYYFVFQGVVLTALCNGNTNLRCSDRWFLATLSALAASLNLAALVSIGRKYNRVITQKSKTWIMCNKLQGDLSNLKEQKNQRGQVHSPRLGGHSSGESSHAADVVQTHQSGGHHHIHTEDSSGHVWDFVDIKNRTMSLVICIVIFLSFAVIVFIACLKIPCRHKN